MTGALDPLHANTEQLHAGLTRPASASMAGGVASVQVSADGALEAIHLTEAGRRLDPDTLVAAIVRLHAAALAESRQVVNAAIAELDADPRLRAQRERYADALDQPLPQQQSFPAQQTQSLPPYQPPASQHQPPTPSQPYAPEQQHPGWVSAPTAPAASTGRAPTQEDDDADDEYFQRESWLEYD
ncbi:hypothetical protein ACFWUP_02375 [Nocardia sp. NPDC058658]|uniref:hypothetical protein n=1 Tax=Nocardia sp. NPDC058658 TaxID=3346580 RepID=UPI0036565F90